jgi:Tol biopolymer transport system component
VAVLEGVGRAALSGEPQIAFSSTGSLLYIPGPANLGSVAQTVLARVDRKGEIELLKTPPGSYSYPRVSRDGKLVAYQDGEGKNSSVWIWELSGASAARRLTLPGTGSNRYPIWSSDGQRVAFQSDREGDLGIWWQRADGNGVAERLTKPDKGVEHIPDSWSKDNETLSFTEWKTDSSAVWTYSLRDKKAKVFAATAGANLANSVFSPDGHWIAYQLSAQPNSRIYLRPFPRTETEFLAPADADTHHPLWSPDGKELFYVAGPSLAGSMSVSMEPTVKFGSPVRAPRSGFQTAVPANVRTYDLLPDGRFLGVVPAATSQASASSGPAQIRVVLNWFTELQQRAPVK